MAIYAYDANIDFSNSTFDNGGISVYADFLTNKRLENNTINDDEFSLDNKNYIVSVESSGIKITLINNSIVVDELPSKFDSRDWGWVSPDKVQGDNDDCWAFATVASLESALLKSTGVLYNLSPNYVQKLQLKYARNGDLRISSTGFAYSGLGHALSWYGTLPMDDSYDDRGMAADTDLSDSRIHLQDAMIIFGGKNDTVNMIKQAIIKYGSVSVQMILLDDGEEIPTAGENISIFDHGIHFVSLVGWDDSIGKWTYKDSLGGFNKINYTSKILLVPDRYAIIPQNAAIAYIFENTVDYHVNYQTDLVGLTGFNGNYTYYSNEFTSKYDELIGAVGTYFNESGIDYSFDIYVNGLKVHTQSGVSEFAGFRTIVLNKYIPIKTGDEFKVVFKNNALPYQAYSRQHYVSGMSFISGGGENFKDITLENKTVCLKVYTVADDTKIINNKDITVNYNGGSYFSVKVITADGRAVGAGEGVKFTIGGKTYSVKTNNNGIAKLKITQIPNKYIIKTSYNGKTYKNTVTVKKTTPKITAKAKTFKKDIKVKKYTIALKTNLNKVMKNVKVTLKVKGKTYIAKTNSKGKATFKITKLIKKGNFNAVITFGGNKYHNKVSKIVKIIIK
ncbi:lectin like domain-containing protein [Methanobrevibacter sp.]|uniref:lectin like domain-containing protein n=1 Tax=Methanobrevibacter sp. TaxID=66852 RepID=UPI0026DEDE6D|nr:lectin like domain-containing protein [Methanobrevibacter sp.]MDO5860906.1 lectin like domain-containing protein [Methanobrevibacter sp.]